MGNAIAEMARAKRQTSAGWQATDPTIAWMLEEYFTNILTAPKQIRFPTRSELVKAAQAARSQEKRRVLTTDPDVLVAAMKRLGGKVKKSRRGRKPKPKAAQ